MIQESSLQNKLIYLHMACHFEMLQKVLNTQKQLNTLLLGFLILEILISVKGLENNVLLYMHLMLKRKQ